MSGLVLAAQPNWYESSDASLIRPRLHNMTAPDTSTQRTRVLALLKRRGITWLAEFSDSALPRVIPVCISIGDS